MNCVEVLALSPRLYLLGALLLAAGGAGAAEPPPLPAGLGTQPATPGTESAAPPPLPSGLEGDVSANSGAKAAKATEAPPPVSELHLDWGGFWEVRGAPRLRRDPRQEDWILAESRVQLDVRLEAPGVTAAITTDFIADPLAESRRTDLEAGRGWLDLREANLLLRPLSFLDIKLGRQILTWGVGDLVFLNDLFPKDQVSFFSGRDQEYLKAPSDALKVSVFTPLANLDLVYSPRFDPDRFISGRRLSFFNPALGRLAGDGDAFAAKVPDRPFTDDEIALRLYRQLGAWEGALYGYWGFWKSPSGLDAQGRFRFPALRVQGASLRGPVGPGLLSLEWAYYDSHEDAAGNRPGIPNSQWRGLVGYEQEIAPELTLGLQYYRERRLDFDELLENQPSGTESPARNRELLTLRLTRLALQQRLTLSLFHFWSPSSEDGHLRLKAGYKLDDNWLLEGGVHEFFGNASTPLGQLQDNAQVFFGLRRSF